MGEGYSNIASPSPESSLNHKTKVRIISDTAKCGGKKYGGFFFLKKKHQR
jgi:hypothetical protein